MTVLIQALQHAWALLDGQPGFDYREVQNKLELAIFHLQTNYPALCLEVLTEPCLDESSPAPSSYEKG